MDQVEQKFQNFTMFLKDNIKDNTQLSLLSNANVNLFLETLKKYNNCTPKEITDKVCARFDIVLSNYSQDVINKFERYIEYFQKVAHII